MSIQVQWDNDSKTIIYFLFDGDWTWEEFYQIIEESNDRMDSVNHPVDAIIDIQNSHLLPNRFFSNIRFIRDNPHANLGMQVLVGANSAIQRLTRTFIQIYPQAKSRFEMVATLEEARAVIAAHRKSMDD